MKIKCVECELVLEPSNEEICKIKSLIEKDSLQEATVYLEIFNLTKGKCKDQKRHTFVFEETFVNSIQDLINRHNSTKSKRDNDADELSKIVGEINELEGKLKATKDKKDVLIEDLKKASDDIENILLELVDITGDGRIDIWG